MLTPPGHGGAPASWCNFLTSDPCGIMCPQASRNEVINLGRRRMTTPAGTTVSVWDTFDHTPSGKQRAFMRYFTAVLVDLVVLNLFVEYWGDKVYASSFTVTLLAAVILQVLLKITIVCEHKVAAYWNRKPGGFAKFMRYFTAWLILFGSKF